MKRLLLVLLMVLMVLYPTMRAADAAADKPADKPQSISALKYEDWTVCTTWSANAAGTWVTDYHCVAGVPDAKKLTIGGQAARALVAWPSDDLALLKTDVGAPALSLAKAAPEVGDVVRMLGYIDNSPTWAYSQGIVMNAHYKMSDKSAIVPGILPSMTTRNFLLAAMPSCKGHSGSPIGNENYEVVSVLQLVPAALCAPVSYGPTWERLVELLKPHITAKEV